MKPIRIKCNKDCISRWAKNTCMWIIDDDLLKRYEDEKYRAGMCPIVIEQIEAYKQEIL